MTNVHGDFSSDRFFFLRFIVISQFYSPLFSKSKSTCNQKLRFSPRRPVLIRVYFYFAYSYAIFSHAIFRLVWVKCCEKNQSEPGSISFNREIRCTQQRFTRIFYLISRIAWPYLRSLALFSPGNFPHSVQLHFHFLLNSNWISGNSENLFCVSLCSFRFGFSSVLDCAEMRRKVQ